MSQMQFNRYQLFSGLLPIGMCLMIINAYFPLDAFGFNLGLWIIPPITSIGLLAYLIWYYQAYKKMCEKAPNPLFYPSIATILAHIPIINFICMPITYKEIWFYLNENKLNLTHKLFLAWLYLQALALVATSSAQSELTVAIWMTSTIINFSLLYFINKNLSGETIHA